MGIKRRATLTCIASRLVALGTASVACRLAALCSAGLASRLAALGLACIAGLASCLSTLRLAGIARITGVLITGIASILPTLCSTRVTRSLITIGTTSACASEPKAFGALLRLAAACLIGDAAKWLSWTFDSYGDGAVEIGIRNVRLSRLPRSCRAQPYVKIKLVLYRRACCARVFNHRILLYADPRRLEAHHWALFGWNRFGKYDILPPELSVIGQRTIEVEPSPAFTVAFSRQTFQYHHI